MITSPHNPKVKWLRQLQSDARLRRAERAFVIEGVRLAEEALAAGWQARLILHTADLSPRGNTVLESFAAQGVHIEAVVEPVLRAASDTQTPQGLIAALEWIDLPDDPQADFILIPDQVRDPGNLGTLLRTAAAAGANAALLPPETADAFAPKTLRAGMGAQFRLPIHSLPWDQIAQRLHGLTVLIASAGKGVPYTRADLRHRLALIVGGEAQGPSAAAQQLATAQIHIPMPGGSESLNAAVAGGILMFEIVRQRSQGEP